MRPRRPLDSFRYASDGVLHCFRTQRHMQIHFLMLILVLVSGLMLNIDSRDMLILLLCICFVMVTELLNTAVETVVDMISPQYNPLAKLAKDVAAGSVLVASTTALMAGLLVFVDSPPLRSARHMVRLPLKRPEITVFLVVGILVIAMTVVSAKLVTGRANNAIWQGGAISGHTAVGFFLAMTIIFTSTSRFVAVLALVMAGIIAQSRVEAKIHSIQEVILGAVIAIFLTSAVYWFMPRLRTSGRQETTSVIRPIISVASRRLPIRELRTPFGLRPPNLRC